MRGWKLRFFFLSQNEPLKAKLSDAHTTLSFDVTSRLLFFANFLVSAGRAGYGSTRLNFKKGVKEQGEAKIFCCRLMLCISRSQKSRFQMRHLKAAISKHYVKW